MGELRAGFDIGGGADAEGVLDERPGDAGAAVAGVDDQAGDRPEVGVGETYLCPFGGGGQAEERMSLAAQRGGVAEDENGCELGGFAPGGGRCVDGDEDAGDGGGAL